MCVALWATQLPCCSSMTFIVLGKGFRIPQLPEAFISILSTPSKTCFLFLSLGPPGCDLVLMMSLHCLPRQADHSSSSTLSELPEARCARGCTLVLIPKTLPSKDAHSDLGRKTEAKREMNPPAAKAEERTQKSCLPLQNVVSLTAMCLFCSAAASCCASGAGEAKLCRNCQLKYLPQLSFSVALKKQTRSRLLAASCLTAAAVCGHRMPCKPECRQVACASLSVAVPCCILQCNESWEFIFIAPRSLSVSLSPRLACSGS